MNRAVFFRQLRYWTLHCLINALPSFLIATFWLKLGKSPSAMAAMFAAILTFILLYSILTSLRGPLADENHLLSRSLKLGAKIRLWISCLSLPLLLSEQSLFFTPDFWCGFLSVGLLDGVAKNFDPGSRSFALADSVSTNGMDNFAPVYAITMVEGFILSFILLMISFFAVISLQARERRRMYRREATCR